MIKMPLSSRKYKGLMAIIDDTDEDLTVLRWRPQVHRGHENVYAWSGKRALHREIMSRMVGRHLTRTEYVDHINGDGLDNRRSNLRMATHSQNMSNRRPARSGTSRYLGIWWDSQKSRWRGEARQGPTRLHIGYFTDEVEAACAYDSAARELHGAFARLNFPEQETRQ